MAEKTINGRKLSDLKVLQASKEFQDVVAKDTIIQAAFRSKEQTRSERTSELLSCLGADIHIDGKAIFPAPPAGVFSLLGLIESPFLYFEKPLTYGDIDAALVLLVFHQDAFKDLNDIDKEYMDSAWGFCQLLKLDYEVAAKAIQSIVSQGFSAFRMIRGGNSPKNNDKRFFDSYWLAGMAVMASSAIPSLTLEQIYWKIPLIEIGFLIVQNLRINQNDERVARRTASFDAMVQLDKLIDEWIPKLCGTSDQTKKKRK